MASALWRTVARRVVAWRHPTDEESIKRARLLLVSLDCGHDHWLDSSSIYWRGRARPRLHCLVCEEQTRKQLDLFKPTRWPT
jgi:hypothetical protein